LSDIHELAGLTVTQTQRARRFLTETNRL